LATTATTTSAAGAYPITVGGAASPNYSMTYVNGVLTVGKSVLTITANNQSTTYGAAIPTLTVSYSGFLNGDTAASLTSPVIVSTTASAASPAGSYSIKASGACDQPAWTARRRDQAVAAVGRRMGSDLCHLP